MTDQNKNLANSNGEKQDIEKMRQAVLKWIENDKSAKAQPAKRDLDLEKEAETITPKLAASPKMPAPEKKMMTRVELRPPKKISGKKIIILLLIILIVAGGMFGVLICQFKWHDPVTLAITKIIPYPVAVVNYQPVFYYDWQEQVTTLNNFYQKEKEANAETSVPSLAETQKHILNRMISQTLLRQLAKKYNAVVTTEEVSQQTDSLAQDVGSRDLLTAQLQSLYGWTIADFQKEILEPLILKEKLKIAITLDDRINQSARDKAELILQEVKAGQKSFAELATTYSEDATAQQGGDLGYFAKGQMVTEFETAAFALKPGEVSDLVKTQFGYHIIKVEEVLTDDKGQTTQVRARHILIRAKDLETYLEELKDSSKIWQLVKI